MKRQKGWAIVDGSVSIIIPTFNGANRIGRCLEALLHQEPRQDVEILVINDGSTDDTTAVVRRYAGVRVIDQANAGPAAARNRGALEAQGSVLLFTDDDCVPCADWVAAMLAPFADPEVVGVKGTYRTSQMALIARFVQIEYEGRYRKMARFRNIDFVDTYSAGFRRERFLEIGGYDTSFPVACAEDVELSYRMAARGWVMKFAPLAVVYHTHPDSLSAYLRKKYKFAYWRILAVRKNPSKGVRDSHTPQLMKLQLLLLPFLILSCSFDTIERPIVPATLVLLAAFLLTTMPFTWRALSIDRAIGLLSPLLLAARACAQFAGVAAGLLRAVRKPSNKVDSLRQYRIEN